MWGKLFGSPAALAETVQGVREGLDALVYTEEEKETDAAVERAAARNVLIEWQRTTQGQNLARRVIAFALIGVWLGQKTIALIGNVVSVWVSDPATWQASAQLIENSSSEITTEVSMIIGFYFAAPYLGKIIDKYRK